MYFDKPSKVFAGPLKILPISFLLSQLVLTPAVFSHSRCATLRSGQFRGQKGLGPLEKPRKMPHYVFCPRKKIISQTFKMSGTLIVNILLIIIFILYIYQHPSYFRQICCWRISLQYHGAFTLYSIMNVFMQRSIAFDIRFSKFWIF
jgi:hypothetical protein